MKTFRFLFLLPLLALGHFGFAGETSNTTTATATNSLAERTVKPAGVRVELPTFDRAIRARVESAAREAAADNPVTLAAPAAETPDLLDASAAAAATHASVSHHPAPANTAKPAAAPHAIHVAGL